MTSGDPDGRHHLRVFLIDHRDGWHRDLGNRQTDDRCLVSVANKGRIIALLRQHAAVVRRGQYLLIDIDGQVSALWRTDHLLAGPSE